MKKTKRILSIIAFVTWSVLSFAQAPPNPGGTEGDGTVGDSGGGAPIGSGVTIMIAAAAVYGFGKHKLAIED